MSLFTALGKDGQNVGGKSTIVHSLVWLIALLASFSITLVFKTQDKVMLYGSLSLLGLEFLIFHGVYFYCLYKNPDLLRSEKHLYDMSKLDKQFRGDNSSGMEELSAGRINSTRKALRSSVEEASEAEGENNG
ncbi:hypothetical protein [Pantoea ananatis]|uniref:hypothetical protein n=1 Tax=Pantoea ananas TaxID=553 RepID=UPI001B303F9C|nr:hypothetical protein [Pantoea ananatis]